MLELTQIITYCAALAVAAFIPGPGMTALVARSVSSGSVTGFAMLAGLILGDLTYLSFAVFGLAVIAKNFAPLFLLIQWASLLYLCYLAWVFWRAEHQDIHISQGAKKKDLFAAGLSGYAITLGNPKTIPFYLALLPVVINLDNISLHTLGLVLVPLTCLILLFVGSVFIFGTRVIRHLLSSHRAQKMIHRGAAVMMMIAVLSMLVQQW